MTPAAIEYLLPHVPNGAPPTEGPDAFFLCEVAWGGEAKEFTFCYRRGGDIALFGVEGDYSVPTLESPALDTFITRRPRAGRRGRNV